MGTVQGRFGYDATYMYFQIELFGDEKVGNNGVRTQDFGESSFYRIRLSDDPDGAGGLMLSAKAAADFQKPEFMAFNAQKAFGHSDGNGDVGGPGGIATVNENPGSMNGFENNTISDGKAEAGAKPKVLFTRRLAGVPIVEFAFEVPEPGSLVLIGLGTISATIFARRRRLSCLADPAS